MPEGMDVFDYARHFNAPTERHNSGDDLVKGKLRARDKIIASGNQTVLKKAKRTAHEGPRYKHNVGGKKGL